MNRTQLPTLFRGLNLRAQRSITSSPVVNLVNKKFEDGEQSHFFYSDVLNLHTDLAS
jgi:hypothetical protein